MTYSLLLGWLAAALTLLAFHCKDMVRLRLLALAANVAFLAYGWSAELIPVLALHAVLIPLNLVRLLQAGRPLTADGRSGGRLMAGSSRGD